MLKIGQTIEYVTIKSYVSAVVTIGLASLTSPPALSASVSSAQKFNIGGDGGTDYITAEPGTGRVFVSRGTHVMVVDGRTGKLLGDIPDSSRNHGIALSARSQHGFITSAGDSAVQMFDLKSLAVVRKIPVSVGGLDGIMHDDYQDRIILTNHSTPGTAVAIDARRGELLGTVELEDNSPEGAASDGKGRLFVNNERKNTMQVIDAKSMKVLASWPLAPCQGPTGIAMDRSNQRLFVGCSRTSVVVDARSGKVVATIVNGEGVDALGWDPAQKLIYIPAGRDGNVTVAHQDSPDRYSVIATVATMNGVKTIAVDPVTHRAYGFTPEYGPAPASDAGPAQSLLPPGSAGNVQNAAPPGGPGSAPPGTPNGERANGPGGGPPDVARGAPRGPVVAGWLFAISH